MPETAPPDPTESMLYITAMKTAPTRPTDEVGNLPVGLIVRLTGKDYQTRDDSATTLLLASDAVVVMVMHLIAAGSQLGPWWVEKMAAALAADMDPGCGHDHRAPHPPTHPVGMYL